MLSYSQHTILGAAVCMHFKSRSAYPDPKHIHIYQFDDPKAFDHYQKMFIFCSRIILVVVQLMCWSLIICLSV
jgi:hypothetical protein